MLLIIINLITGLLGADSPDGPLNKEKRSSRPVIRRSLPKNQPSHIKCLAYFTCPKRHFPTNFKSVFRSPTADDNDVSIISRASPSDHHHHALRKCAFALFLLLHLFSSVVLRQWPTHCTDQLSRCVTRHLFLPWTWLILARILEGCCEGCRRLDSKYVRRQ